MSRPSRADAERNRLKVLEVAEALFAERGDAVQMAEVARAAEVGVGTVYRHFPTRQALIEAIAERRFEEILTYAEQHCLPQPTAHQGLACLLTRVGEVHERGRGLSGVIDATFGSTAPRGAVGDALLTLGETLARRGREDGTLRPDVTIADLYMAVGAVAMLSRHAVGDWRRFRDLTLDGLRPH
ncbi:TetR/AcrR family transcriptional regulator [Streptomyces sp. NPDC057702]|uniref:TetR/AcrR family transcriptional regulator n=1 Tax=unclassified Streptomyces TaxID=2593676 RepID=UPI00368D66C7